VGFAIAFTVVTAIPWALDPAVFGDYRQMLHQASIGNEFIPALSGVLRLIFFHRLFWVQFIPLVLGLLCFLRFCFRNWAHWDWRHHGLMLMIVSVLTTPYSWLSDEVVLLPAILQAAVCIFGMPKNKKMNFATRLAVIVFAF
jgi:hypothetical protein